MDRWNLWLAQGLGAGKIPMAPGTWGSFVGLLWFFVLLIPGHPAVFFAGATAAVAVSIGSCGRAERQLGRTDPPSVVLDEVVAVPWCFASWILLLFARQGRLPDPVYFLQLENAWQTALVFMAFRGFDVGKPWPIRSSQRWPGGWGITIDDLLAALYVNALWGAAYGLGCLVSQAE